MFAYDDDELIPISNCDPDQYCRGDVVWISFLLAYIVGGVEWYPDMRPIDYVKVGHVEKNAQVSVMLDAIPATHLASGKIQVSDDSESGDEAGVEHVAIGE